MRFDDLPPNRIKTPLSEMRISMARRCRCGLARRPAVVAADEVPADPFRRHLRVPQLPEMHRSKWTTIPNKESPYAAAKSRVL